MGTLPYWLPAACGIIARVSTGAAGAAEDMRLYREVTGRRDEIIRAGFAAGASVAQVAKAMGITRDTVYKVLGPAAAEESLARAARRLEAFREPGR